MVSFYISTLSKLIKLHPFAYTDIYVENDTHILRVEVTQMEESIAQVHHLIRHHVNGNPLFLGVAT